MSLQHVWKSDKISDSLLEYWDSPQIVRYIAWLRVFSLFWTSIILYFCISYEADLLDLALFTDMHKWPSFQPPAISHYNYTTTTYINVYMCLHAFPSLKNFSGWSTLAHVALTAAVIDWCVWTWEYQVFSPSISVVLCWLLQYLSIPVTNQKIIGYLSGFHTARICC